MTSFATIYNRFLLKVTDDMYVELTPQDTLNDLQNLLLDAISGFEFPRINLYDYSICAKKVPEEELSEDAFIIDQTKDELDSGIFVTPEGEEAPVNMVLIDDSYFTADLTTEEINILANLMLDGWLQRQITSIENTRMKYSGSDFKFTSQANHLAKLITAKDKVLQMDRHMQRLYKRRKFADDGRYKSNWRVFRPRGFAE